MTEMTICSWTWYFAATGKT